MRESLSAAPPFYAGNTPLGTDQRETQLSESNNTVFARVQDTNNYVPLPDDQTKAVTNRRPGTPIYVEGSSPKWHWTPINDLALTTQGR